MNKSLRFVGLDVHKDSITVAVAVAGREPAELVGKIEHDENALLELLGDLGPKARLRLCYEAGPTGYGLARRLNEWGFCCEVVAPSLVPVQGGRIKTDRRDARKLAHFLRSGDLTAVRIPEAQTEAIRDLERAREDAKAAERVVRHQLDKFLLRHGRIWSGGTKWTCRHWAWIRQQEFAEPAARAVRDDGIEAVEQATQRVERLTQARRRAGAADRSHAQGDEPVDFQSVFDLTVGGGGSAKWSSGLHHSQRQEVRGAAGSRRLDAQPGERPFLPHAGRRLLCLPIVRRPDRKDDAGRQGDSHRWRLRRCVA